MHLYFYVTFKKMSYYLRNFTQKNLEISRENTKAWKRNFCSRNDFVPLCTYLFIWLPICDQHLNQSTFLLIFILFHYIACLKDLKIYQHFDYNHTTAKESIFFLTEPCRTLFFFPICYASLMIYAWII